MALVNTERLHEVANALPSPMVFNHAIVAVRLNDEWIFFDPTDSYDAGDLDERSLNEYGFALLVRADTTGLEPVFNRGRSANGHDLIETYTILQGSPEATLSIDSRPRGSPANHYRSLLDLAPPGTLDESFANFYRREYDQAETVTPLSIGDGLPFINRLILTATYNLPRFLRESSDKPGSLEATVRAHHLADFITWPQQPVRSSPLYLDHLGGRHEIRLVFSGPAEFEDSDEGVANIGFYFKFSTRWRPPILTLNYSWLPADRDVQPSEMPEYLEALEQVEDLLAYTIQVPAGESSTAQPPAQPPAPSTPKLDGITPWYLLPLAAAVITAGLAATWRPVGPPPVPLIEDGKRGPAGLGGWLVLPIIGLALDPFVASWGLFMQRDVLAASAWSALTDPSSATYHPLWASTILAEAYDLQLALLLSPVLWTLLLKKKRQFPRIMICYLLLGIPTAFPPLIAKLLAPGVFEDFVPTHPFSVIGRSIIWTFYFLQSRRVRNTFIN